MVIIWGKSDEKLTWKAHLDKMKSKCENKLNILRSLSGQTWAASRASLTNAYWALVRSAFDYGCAPYMSAAESNTKFIDVLQMQALRICSGYLSRLQYHFSR